ncbi:MAG: exonuclease [Rhodobacteraceae bacterium]|nr:MAG: exonuclease [Paracoccaceae bacterium]
MAEIVLFDCEYLTQAGAMDRLWSGRDDPDPMVVQIGAVRLDLAAAARVIDETRIHITPEDRHGAPCALSPYFTELTGISQEALARDARPLGPALAAFDAFSRGAHLWSWGKDELFALGISCFLRGIAPPIPAVRFGNLKRVLKLAGMSDAEIAATSSGRIAAHFGLAHQGLRQHDALDDARSLTRAVQHLMARGDLTAETFAIAAMPPMTGPSGRMTGTR